MPSAENLALFLPEAACPELLRGEPFKLRKVWVWEDSTAYVEVSLE